MDPIDFLTTAQESIGKREVDYRNAASRAYYSAFHLCKGLVESFPIGASHEKVILALREHPDKRMKSLGNSLQQIKEIRVHADYKLDGRAAQSSDISS